MSSAKQWPFFSGLDVLTHNKIRFLQKLVKKIEQSHALNMLNHCNPTFFRSLVNLYSFDSNIWEKNEGMLYFDHLKKKKIGEMYSFQLHFRLFTVFQANVRYWASLSNNRVPPPPSTTTHPLLKCKGLNLKCHLNIRKHRPWACILGFIELPYFGSEQFRQIYLVERICICICIWIDVFIFVFIFESKLNKIFVFVFVFEKSKFLYLYLYLYLIKRIWPQPCKLKFSLS